MAQKAKHVTKKSELMVAVPFIVAAVVFSVVISIMLIRNEKASETPTTSPLVYDDAAVVGGWDEADLDAIVDGLNEKVETGMINISMNTAPTFEDGTAAGDLMIVNDSCNNYPQVVVLTRNDTGEEIYRSGGIPVGSKIESAALDVALPAGTYECTAMFHNIDPDTGESLGCAGAIITVTVLA